MKLLTTYHIEQVDSPFWAFAIHDGHQLDESLQAYQRLSPEERLREEDPFTAAMAELAINQFIVGSSRFQLDLNRNLANAIYLQPEQAWGLNVWRDLPEDLLQTLQKEHALVYQEIDALIQQTIERHGYFFIYDIHSYNAQRNGPEEEIDTVANPQINLGTAYVQPKWRPLVAHFQQALQDEFLYGKVPDVRENVKFKGGYLNQYLNAQYGEHGCVVSIEFRKDFMNEWTGAPDPSRITACKQLLMNSVATLKQYFAYDRQK